MKKTVLSLYIFLLLPGLPAAADGTADPLLMLAPTPRGAALGNTGAARLESSLGLFYNPAASAGSFRTELAASLDLRSDKMLQASISGSLILIKDRLWLNFMETFLVPTKDDGTDRLRDDLFYGTNQSMHLVVGTGLSWAPTPWLAAGIMVKYMTVNQEEAPDFDSPLLDLGWVLHPKQIPFRAGLSLQNIYIHRYAAAPADPFPFVWRFSVVWEAVKSFVHSLEITSSLLKAEGHATETGFGVEYLHRERFFLRCGWHTYDTLPRLGIGFQDISVAVTLKLDLSYQYNDWSGHILKFAVSAGF